MYYKLAFRNAKRSIIDYLLYITTMTILIVIMCISNCVAVFGEMQAGFQTASLPLLIVLIMAALVNYINIFMLKQRAKEFATYLLLGMEKIKLMQMFLLEFCFIGLVCFFAGILIGAGIYIAVFSHVLQGAGIHLLPIAKSILQTFFFFVIVEILSAFLMRQKVNKLQINELMNEKRRNQPLREQKKRFWGSLFAISFSVLLLLLCGIVFFPEDMVYPIVSFISIPLLCCIFAFYKWIYASFSAKRISQSKSLYQDNRLYHIAEITSGTKTSALMSAVFCICLLFSAMAFVFGTLLLNPEIAIFDTESQQWMGFLQISMCIIFITIYFSILSLQQIVELKRQENSIRVLYYMGKNQAQIKSLIKIQIFLKLSMPTLLCFALLLIGMPFINHKLNMLLPVILNDFLIKAVGGFGVCFAGLYFCYFLIIYIISKRYCLTAPAAACYTEYTMLSRTHSDNAASKWEG